MRNDLRSFCYLQYILFPLLTVFFLLIVDVTSIISYFYLLLLFFVFNKMIAGEWLNRNFAYLHYYICISLFLFFLHRILIPNYLGMTGPEGGIGTDDCRYYAQLVDGQVPYPIRFDFLSTFSFVKFLQVLYPLKIETPLNIIIPNLLGVVFLPYYVNRLSFLYTGSKKVSIRAEYLFLLCPFTTYYGCILMRDMWIVTFVFAGLYYFILKRYIVLIICILLIVYIRFGSVVFLGIGIFVIMREQLYKHFSTRIKGHLALFLLLGVVAVIFALTFPYLQEFSGGKLEDGLFRSSFYLMLESIDSDAFILRLMDLIFPLNLLSLTIFFFFLPFLSLTLYTFGIFNIGYLFCSFLTPVFFFFLWNNVIQTVLQSLSFKYNNSINTIVYMAILFAMCLGTVSLQARHKTILFPLLCIIAAYGICNTNNRYSKISYLLAATCVLIQLYMAL